MGCRVVPDARLSAADVQTHCSRRGGLVGPPLRAGERRTRQIHSRIEADLYCYIAPVKHLISSIAVVAALMVASAASAAAPAFTVTRAEHAVVAAIHVWDRQTHRQTPAFHVVCVTNAGYPKNDSCSVRTVRGHANLFGDVGALELARGNIHVGSDDDVLDCTYHANDDATCRRQPSG